MIYNAKRRVLRRGLGRVLTAAGLVLGLGAAPAVAAGAKIDIIDHEFSFEGMFGTFDRAQLRRGWQVYAEVCASCHALEHLSYRHLGDPGGPEFAPEDVKAIAEAADIEDLDADGYPELRPGRPSDKIARPYPNEKAAASANGGAVPPDLSLITKARTACTGTFKQFSTGVCGPEYVYSLLLGYQDEPPEGFDPGDQYYNKYYPGHRIAMAQPMYEEQIEYLDGTEATLPQMAEDVSAFLHWAAEPKLVERKQAGLRNILFLTVLAVLLWYSNRKLWAPVKKG